MPRYFFHVRDSLVIRDEVGTELPDDDSARAEAVRLLAGMIKDHAGEFWKDGRWPVQVREASGRTVATLDFLGQVPIPRAWARRACAGALLGSRGS